jgi:gliding motility-associated-like protein
MKKLLFTLLISVIYSSTFAQCPNGGLEAGNFSNWDFWQGNNATGVININNLIHSRSVTAQIVDRTHLSAIARLPGVNDGNFALKLGNEEFGGAFDIGGYTFTVTNSNKTFSFDVQGTLTYFDRHNNAQQSFIQWFMCLGNTLSLDPALAVNAIGSNALFKARLGDPNYTYGRTINGSTEMYIPYKRVCVDLSAYLGQIVSIYFVAAGCTVNDHPAVLYVDALCKAANPVPVIGNSPDFFCQGDEFSLDGSASQNVDFGFWRIEKLDNNGNPVPGTEREDAFRGSAGSSPVYNSAGEPLECNTDYLITLGVRGTCFPTVNRVSKRISIKCASVDAGDDIRACCTNGQQSFQIGKLQTPAYLSYTWTDKQGNFISNQMQPVVNPSNSTRYTLSVTDQNGCKASDNLFVIYENSFLPVISQQGCCAAVLTADLVPLASHECAWLVNDFTDPEINALRNGIGNTYLWNTGETTQSIVVTPGTTPGLKQGLKRYTVTVSNGCFTRQETRIVNTYSGPFPALAIPNIFTPNGDGINEEWIITEVGIPINEIQSYRSYNYRLQVFTRIGGGLNKTNTICGDLKNGEIRWDGRINGKKVPFDTYFYILELFNCDNPNPVPGNGGYSGYVTVIY